MKSEEIVELIRQRVHFHAEIVNKHNCKNPLDVGITIIHKRIVYELEEILSRIGADNGNE